MSSVPRYPLSWPVGWERTPPEHRKQSRYRVSERAAQHSVIDALRLMGSVGEVVISTNKRVRRDGLPYASDREPTDPGVAVYWTAPDGTPMVLACDCWQTVRENYRAIAASLEAMRALERAGATQVLRRAYDGFKALPAETSSEPRTSCWEVLNLSESWVMAMSSSAAAAHVNIAYRDLARKHHPDCGGSAEMMARINTARDQAIALIRER